MYKYEKLEKNKVKITISYSREEWEKFVEQAYEENKEKFNIQGFRKGKAPRRVIEKNYGESIFYDDAFDICFRNEYKNIFENEKDFDPVEQPKVSLEKFDDKEVVLVAEVDNMPPVKLGEYKGLEIKKAVGEVKQEQVEKELNQVRERQARFVDVEREAKLKDVATIDFVGSVDGVVFEGGSANDHRLELGSHSFIDGFEDQVVGMHLGETKDVNVTFPEDYQAEELKGKPAVFAVTLKKLEEKQLPELNDEFASNVSEFETLEEYKKDIEKHLQESLDKKLERETENNILEAVVTRAEVEIPQVLIDRQLDMFVRDFEMRLSYQGLKLDDYLKYMNTNLEDMKKERTEQAKETVKTRLVLEELIKIEKLQVDDEELEAKLTEIASKYKKSLDEYKKSLGEKNIEYYRNDILMDKVIKFLKENNKLA